MRPLLLGRTKLRRGRRRTRLRNAQGSIRAQMEAQIGGAATFAWADIRTEQIVQDDDTGCFRGFYQIPLTIEWKDGP